jgi:uncharacterized protein
MGNQKILKKNFIFIFVALGLTSLSFPLQADPWGKDADLAYPAQCVPETNTCTTPFLGKIGEVLIKFHQDTISPADGPRSHFYPSSSQYTLDGMRKYGFFKGWLLGCDRLMRENPEPWVYKKINLGNNNVMKWDPVR